MSGHKKNKKMLIDHWDEHSVLVQTPHIQTTMKNDTPTVLYAMNTDK
jgi:hypothetical protein